MAVASTIRVEIVWQLNGVDWAVNVLHYTTGSSEPLTQAMVDAIGSSVSGAFSGSGLNAAYANESKLDRVRVRDLRTDGNPVLEDPVSSLGTSSAVINPAQTAVVTTLRSTNASRRGRGRVFWPAPATGANDVAGTIAPGTVNLYNAFVTDLMTIGAGALGDLVLGVYSRADDVTRTVVQHVTNNIFDVQTRRRDLSIS